MFVRDPWLSDVIEMPCFRMGALPVGADARAIASAMRAVAPQGRAFFFAKHGTADMAGVETLVRAGHNVTDVSVTFLHEGGCAHEGECCVVEVATEVDATEVADLAGRCFTFSRFHADSRIGTNRANAVKREWARNSCLGRAAVVYVVRLAGRVAGFLAVLKREGQAGSEAIIDLVGVDAAHQGKGLGRAMTLRFIRDWGERAGRLSVGTQAVNIPALRLYERLGFRISETAYVLHAHARDGEVMA